MTDSQILAIALASAPTMLTVLISILINNSRLTDMNHRIADFRAHVDSRFSQIDARFDDMRTMWQSELRRVEEILDARPKHLEER